MDSLAIRRRLFREQNGKCHYCDVKMHMNTHRPGKPSSPTGCTIDHIIPKAEGGGNAKSNLVGACFLCNNIRGLIPYKAFVWFIKHYGRGVLPLHAFMALDRKSPAYLDNLSTWGDLLHGRGRKVVHTEEQHQAIARHFKVDEAIPPWEPEWKERRRYLTLARRNIKDIVSSVPYYQKNAIWLEYLKQEKASAGQY